MGVATEALAFISIFLTVWTIIEFAFDNLKSPYKGIISGGIAGLLAPRINEFETQSGRKVQLKWIFLSKPVFI